MKRTAALVAFSTVLAGPALLLMQQPANAACAVFAKTPVVNSGPDEVVGQGGRSGCTGRAYIEVELKWDRPLSPDPVLQRRSGTYQNVTLYPTDNCLAGTHDYYTNLGGDGGSALSGRRAITGLNC